MIDVPFVTEKKQLKIQKFSPNIGKSINPIPHGWGGGGQILPSFRLSSL